MQPNALDFVKTNPIVQVVAIIYSFNAIRDVEGWLRIIQVGSIRYVGNLQQFLLNFDLLLDMKASKQPYSGKYSLNVLIVTICTHS